MASDPVSHPAKSWWWLFAAMLGAIVLAIIGTTPPAPTAVSAPATVFSAARAMADVRVIGRAPHPTGSAQIAAVRAHLIGRLQAMGLEVSTPGGRMSAKAAHGLDLWRGKPAPPPPLVNVLGLLPGQDRSLPAVLLMAHHDSVWGSPGAADDGAGVAAILETVRAIKAQGPMRRDLLVLLTDGEELGLQGATAFFAGDPHRSHVGVVINMESRGGGGRTAMFETGDHAGGMMTLFGQAVHRPFATSLTTFIYGLMPNRTDYTIARKLGYPGFNFAFIGRPAQYHSPLSTPEVFDQGSLQDMGQQVLDLTRALLAAPTLPERASEHTFFDVFGLFLVSYPAWVGWLLLAGAALGYAVGAGPQARLRDILRGAGATLALPIGSALLLYVGNLLSGADGKVNYYDRLAALPRLEVQALLLCLASAMLVWELARHRQPVGLALPVFAFALIAQALAPTASFPLILPLVLGGAAACVGRLAGYRVGMTASMIAAMLGIGFIIALFFVLFQAVGAPIPMIAALPVTLCLMLAGPLVPVIDRRKVLIAAGALILLAVGIALWVRLDAVSPSVPVYSSFT